MPNSRIETAFFLTEDDIELLGAWTTNGNNLLGGGGDKLGSLDNFGFEFITSGIRRGGFLDSGEFYLQQNGANLNSKYVKKPIRFITSDELDFNAFSFLIPDNTTYKFNVELQYRQSGGNIWGGFERKILVNRAGILSTKTLETMPFTERVNSIDTNIEWILNGNTIELNVNGISSSNLVWSGLISYQGILSI